MLNYIYYRFLYRHIMKFAHKWIVGLYNKYEGVEGLHRYFGVFETKEEAKEFAANYREKYTKSGFIKSIRVFPLCEVVK